MRRNKTIPATARLLDEEARVAAEKREAISRVALEIETILLRESLTMGDFLEVVDLFTSRANQVFAKIPMKQIKDTYGK